MSVPIAVTGAVPTTRIRSGVIRDAPPIPVMPTSVPIKRPRTITSGFIRARREYRRRRSALDPDLGVRQQGLELPRELLRDDVSERDALENAAEIGADRDPDVAQPLGCTFVVEVLRRGLVNVREGALDGADDVGDGDFVGRFGEPVAAASAPARLHQACMLELEQDVLHEVERDVLRLGDALALDRVLSGGRELECGAQRV